MWQSCEAFWTLKTLGELSAMGSRNLLSNLGKRIARCFTSTAMVAILDRAQKLGCVAL